jgi:hypothetical protein
MVNVIIWMILSVFQRPFGIIATSHQKSLFVNYANSQTAIRCSLAPRDYIKHHPLNLLSIIFKLNWLVETLKKKIVSLLQELTFFY